MDTEISVQERFAPKSICFGCGPANSNGLQIQSMVDKDALVASWWPQSHHQAFPGMLNGGIIGSLLDCHSNWTAAYALMQERNLDKPPCTVTASFEVKLLRPTPSNKEVHLIARPVSVDGDKVRVNAELSADDKVSATFEGLFVAVKEGHPAFHQW